MYFFCTYFDSHFLTRGLALYESLLQHCPSFRLFILCMDDKCYELLSRLNLPLMEPIRLADFEKEDEALLSAKKNRSRIEYYFTCTPSLPLYVLNHYPDIDIITYLDADLFFFSDPAPLYQEFSGHSIAIISHRFSPVFRHLEMHGKYNVAYLSFRRDSNGFSCLKWWREKCIEWCYDRPENGRFADQKYLDEWPVRFQGVMEFRHKGANLAPWNIANYNLHYTQKKIQIDNDPLIFYHFHGFRQIADWLWDPNLADYKARVPRNIVQNIYLPYIKSLLHAEKRCLALYNEKMSVKSVRYQLKDMSGTAQIRNIFHKIANFFRIVLSGNFIQLR